MSKNEKALKQWFQLGQEIMSGTSDISAEDIDRARRRPHGPHGHPMLVMSERLRRPQDDEDCVLVDLAVRPDGTYCTLWKLVGDQSYGLCALTRGGGDRTHRRDLQDQLLMKHEPAVCDAGRIVGFNIENVPVIEMVWTPTDEAGAKCSMIYIGRNPVDRTHSQATQQTHQAWTMGGDGRLWCVEKRSSDKTAQRLHLIGFDAYSGAVRYDIPLQGDLKESDFIDSLAVRDYNNYALTACEYDRMKAPRFMHVHEGEVGGHRMQNGRVELIDGEIHLSWSDDERSVSSWKRLTADPQQSMSGSCRRTYRGGLTRLLGEGFAYVGQTAGGQVGWIFNELPQPCFARVTKLFQHGDSWRYWALADAQLFLMELPLKSQK